MTSHAEEKLELVENEIKVLKARRYELLDKEIKQPSEIVLLKDFKEELAELKAKEKYWQDRIPKGV